MYVKASSRKTKDGQVIRYLQLAHNEWDSAAGASRTKILHSFGREDELDKDSVKRLVAALSRLLDPAGAVAAATPGELSISGSRPVGGTSVLDGIWRQLGLDQVIRGQLAGRRIDPRVERVLFALTANRALAASSKLAAAGWITADVHIDGLGEIDDDACYRAMDYLLTIEPDLAKAGVFPGHRSAEPGSRPAVLRHHLHILRDRRSGRPGGPRRARAGRGGRQRQEGR